MTPESIIEKIKSLLALSSDPSTTEHERSLAFTQAKRLIDRYTVSEQDLHPDTKLEILWVPFAPSGLYKISETLRKKLPFIINQIGFYFGCFTAVREYARTISIVGYKHNIEVTQYAANVLLYQGTKDFVAAYKERLRITRSHSDPTITVLGSAIDLLTFQDAFWDGFLQALVRRFKRDAEPDASAELTVYDPVKQLRDSMNKMDFVSHYGAASEGFDSGTKAQLHKPLTTQTKGNLLE